MKNQHLSYRSGNPVLTSNAFNLQSDYSDKMTIGGTVNKTFLTLMILIGSAYYSWTYISITNVLLLPAVIGGFIVAIITIRKKEWAPITVPIYGVFQGIIVAARNDAINKPIYPHSAKASISKFNPLLIININSDYYLY